MNISNTQLNKVSEIHLQKVRLAGVNAAGTINAPDQLTISGQANEMQHIKKLIGDLPATRENVVREYRAKIDSGKYQPSDDAIASAILGIPAE